MYETHFGLTGSPFRLVPDPSFYFDSRTHANALAYLKFGVFQAEGFIVVTGEVGAGKTTLVRTLLGELSDDEVIAAHVVTTRLDPEDLLRSTLVAFGIAPTGPTKAHLLSTLEGFLTAVAANGKRALLVVDEAQNLSHAAIEELRMLSNFQIGNRPLLQSFLVGQPELRKLVQDPTLEQFRQRIIASCHLGPLAPSETRAYIEHRLTQAGWTGRPHFTDDSFERIHRHTGGIPRRINLLCNRLLLSACLRKSEEIAREDVEQTASDLSAELGGWNDASEDEVPTTTPVRPSARPARAEAAPAESRVPEAEVPEVSGGLVCLVDSDWSYALGGLVCQALAQYQDGPKPVIVHLGEEPGFRMASLLGGEAESLPPEVFLHLPKDASPRRIAQLSGGFIELLGRLQPRAMITSGTSDEVLTCVMAARREGVPTLRLEAGTWGLDGSCQDSAIAAMIDRVAAARYAPSTQALRALRSEGLPEAGTVCPGSLTAALLRTAVERGESSSEAASADERAWRVLVSVQPSELAWHSAQGDEWNEGLRQLGQRAALLSQMGQSCEVVWLLKSAGWDKLQRAGDDERLLQAGVRLVKPVDYLDELRWLARSDCLVASSKSPLREEAVAMQLPIAHVPGAELAPSAGKVVNPGGLSAYVVSMLGTRHRLQLGDEVAAKRIAEHLRGVLSVGTPPLIAG
jgi:putative secretion ATPase (PEP-CTERM system associated)